MIEVITKKQSPTALECVGASNRVQKLHENELSKDTRLSRQFQGAFSYFYMGGVAHG